MVHVAKYLMCAKPSVHEIPNSVTDSFWFRISIVCVKYLVPFVPLVRRLFADASTIIARGNPASTINSDQRAQPRWSRGFESRDCKLHPMTAPPFAVSDPLAHAAGNGITTDPVVSAGRHPISPTTPSRADGSITSLKRTLSGSGESVDDGDDSKKTRPGVKRACNECRQQKVNLPSFGCTSLSILFDTDSYSSVAMSCKFPPTNHAIAADASSLTARLILPSRGLGKDPRTWKWRRRFMNLGANWQPSSLRQPHCLHLSKLRRARLQVPESPLYLRSSSSISRPSRRSTLCCTFVLEQVAFYRSEVHMAI